MVISPLRLVNMSKKQKNFEVKMRRRGLINMQTKEQFIGRHFGIRCMSVMKKDFRCREQTFWNPDFFQKSKNFHCLVKFPLSSPIPF